MRSIISKVIHELTQARLLSSGEFIVTTDKVAMEALAMLDNNRNNLSESERDELKELKSTFENRGTAKPIMTHNIVCNMKKPTELNDMRAITSMFNKPIILHVKFGDEYLVGYLCLTTAIAPSAYLSVGFLLGSGELEEVDALTERGITVSLDKISGVTSKQLVTLFSHLET